MKICPVCKMTVAEENECPICQSTITYEPMIDCEKEKLKVLSAFLTEKWQSQNFGRELVFSADLCYNGANEKPSSGRKVARVA